MPVAASVNRPGHAPVRPGVPLSPLAPVALLALLAGVPACARQTPAYTPAPGASFFTGAGDIAECGTAGAESTARLLDRIPGLVWTTGDNAYPAGTARDFELCYDPTWGRHRARTRPTPGNHEYWTPGALPYFAYFGDAAGTAGEGWYTFEYAGWRVVALNSNVETGVNSSQLRWLRSVLNDDSHRCTVAYFHHPLVSSGSHGSNPDALEQADVRSFWAALHAAGAEIILAGHDHHYERFAPMTPRGTIDPDRGIRQFIVGTGGGTLRGQGPSLHPASEFFQQGVHGVLKLELRADGYGWEFVSIDGRVLDRGDGVCH